MAARIAFSTHYPDRMGELAGKPTRFPEKILANFSEIEMADDDEWLLVECIEDMLDSGYKPNYDDIVPKTTTIRKNYKYWKAKEGQLIQPFIWAGKPYRSKHVLFCPPVLLKKVDHIEIIQDQWIYNCATGDPKHLYKEILINGWYLNRKYYKSFTENEGFDDWCHFFRWFDSNFEGALLHLGE